MDAKRFIAALEKVAQSTPVTEAIAGVPGNMMASMLPGGTLLPSVSYIAGLMSDEDNSKKDLAKALIPGVSSYRRGNRIKTQVMRELAQIEKDKKNSGARPVAHAVGEHIGPTTSAIASSLVGAGIGGVLGGSRGGARVGALVGGGAAALANAVAMIAAAIKRRRTKQEQIESDKKSLLAKYLLPGKATYDYYKRVGRSQGEIEEDPQNQKREKKAEATASGTPGYGAFGVDWDNVRKWFDDAKAKYYDNQDDATKMLITGGGAALGGALLSKLLGGSGIGGAVLGGIAGVAPHVDWKAISDSLSKKPGQKVVVPNRITAMAPKA